MDRRAKKAATLFNFLQDHRAEKGSAFTHTSIYHPVGSFYVSPEDLPCFFELYKEAFTMGEDLYLTEKHREIGPVVVDLDFRFDPLDSASALHRYSTEDIAKVVEIYSEALMACVEGMENVVAYVMEKPKSVVDKGVEKDGVHIVFPDVVTAPAFQFVLRERVMPKVAEALAHLPLKNPIEDVIDEAVIERNNWQMLGSKKPHCERYSVTRVMRWSDGRVEDDAVPEDVELIERLSIRNKHRPTGLQDDCEAAVRAYEAKVQEEKMKSHFKSTVLSKTRNQKRNETEDDFKQACVLVDLLGAGRAESYYDWIRVGWCLRNIDHRLLDKWVAFSKKSPKFKAGECERVWNYMRQDGACLGMGTLHLWAKQDDPEQYNKYVDAELRTLIRESYNGSEYDIARVIQRKYNHMFAYDSGCKMWFYFADHRWHPTSDGLALKRKLPTEIAAEYRKAASFYITLANQTEDTAQKNVLDELVTKLQAIVNKLKRAAFQSCVMTECAMLFNIDKFDEKLDSNRHLVGFENGVYDLDAMEFRDGRPEDFVSLSTGINYVPYDGSLVCLPQVQAFLSQVLPIERVREYVLRLLSSFLHGNIREERFHVWTGSGCFAIDTPVMMADGTIKRVQDVEVGDQVMGDDSTPRTVLKLHRGRDKMYEIIPTKGESFVVNQGHNLPLKATNFTIINYSKRDGWRVLWKEYDLEKVLISKGKRFQTEADAKAFVETVLPNNKNVCRRGDIIHISVEKFLQNMDRIGKRHLSLYRTSIDFPEKPVSVDPYMFGYWLGDGTSCHSSITTADPEVVAYMHEVWGGGVGEIRLAQEKGKASTYAVNKKKGADTCVFKELRELGVINNKHIPSVFLHNSRDVRLQVLAGIIDSDGHYQAHTNQFEVTFKSERLMDDLVSLARSLGFAAFKYTKKTSWTYNGQKKSGTAFRTQIVGDLLSIPTKIARKMEARQRIKNKDVSLTGFDIKEAGDEDYYGFELDGNHRFLMADNVVQLNSNGKSKILELYQKAFGEYCCTLPIALLTQKRGSSSGASPELARARSKRFACLQEPGENERLNIGLMKEMTGGDKLYARGLYREGMEFKPQFKMILTCNHLPLVPSDDGGTWRRIRVVRFESKFCENPDPSKPNEFPIDTSLSQKFDDWAEALMSLLIEYYKKTITEKIKEPEEVLECTREYQRRNDIIADFLDSAVVKDDNGFLQLGEAFNDFKSWLKDEGCTDRSMRKSDFQSYIEKVYGKASMVSKLKGWKGYKLKSSLVETNAADDYD